MYALTVWENLKNLICLIKKTPKWTLRHIKECVKSSSTSYQSVRKSEKKIKPFLKMAFERFRKCENNELLSQKEV